MIRIDIAITDHENGRVAASLQSYDFDANETELLLHEKIKELFELLTHKFEESEE